MGLQNGLRKCLFPFKTTCIGESSILKVCFKIVFFHIRFYHIHVVIKKTTAFTYTGTLVDRFQHSLYAKTTDENEPKIPFIWILNIPYQTFGRETNNDDQPVDVDFDGLIFIFIPYS